MKRTTNPIGQINPFQSLALSLDSSNIERIIGKRQIKMTTMIAPRAIFSQVSISMGCDSN